MWSGRASRRTPTRRAAPARPDVVSARSRSLRDVRKHLGGEHRSGADQLATVHDIDIHHPAGTDPPDRAGHRVSCAGTHESVAVPVTPESLVVRTPPNRKRVGTRHSHSPKDPDTPAAPPSAASPG